MLRCDTEWQSIVFSGVSSANRFKRRGRFCPAVVPWRVRWPVVWVLVVWVLVMWVLVMRVLVMGVLAAWALARVPSRSWKLALELAP